MRMSIRFRKAVQRSVVLSIAGWLACVAPVIAVDATHSSSSTPPAESDNFVAVWKQLIAARAEVAQLREEAAEQGSHTALVQDLKRQLAETSASLALTIRQFEAVEPEKNRLQQEVLALQQRVAPLPALEAEVQRLQAEGRRLTATLTKAQTENDVLIRTRNLMLEKQVETQLTRDAAMRTMKNKMKALEQEKKKISKALAGAEGNTRRELAAQQADVAAKDKALSQLESQIQKLKTETEKGASRTAEIEQKRAQEKTQADTTAKELQKTLEAEQTRAGALEKENAKISKQADKLEKKLESIKTRAKTKTEKDGNRILEIELQRAQETALAETTATELSKNLKAEQTRAGALEKENAKISKQAGKLEKKLESAKARAKAQTKKQIQQLKVEAEKEATRAAELEQRLAQEQTQSAAAVKELKKNLKAEQTRSAALKKEKTKLSKKVRKLEKALKKEKTRAKVVRPPVQKKADAPPPAAKKPSKAHEAEKSKMPKKQGALEQEKTQAQKQSPELEERAEQDKERQKLRQKIADALNQPHQGDR